MFCDAFAEVSCQYNASALCTPKSFRIAASRDSEPRRAVLLADVAKFRHYVREWGMVLKISSAAVLGILGIFEKAGTGIIVMLGEDSA